jgi:hypothetical protein
MENNIEQASVRRVLGVRVEGFKSVGPVLNRQIGDAAEFAFIVGDNGEAELKKRLLSSVQGLPTFDVFGRRIVPAIGKEILWH